MKAGDYVRDRDGNIFKLNNIIYQDDNFIQYQLGGRLEYKYLLKSGPNIIDLIEVGDYVNGVRVDEIKNGEIRTSSHYDGYICNLCVEEDIKSILTKEQFESMEYKVD